MSPKFSIRTFFLRPLLIFFLFSCILPHFSLALRDIYRQIDTSSKSSVEHLHYQNDSVYSTYGARYNGVIQLSWAWNGGSLGPTCDSIGNQTLDATGWIAPQTSGDTNPFAFWLAGWPTGDARSQINATNQSSSDPTPFDSLKNSQTHFFPFEVDSTLFGWSDKEKAKSLAVPDHILDTWAAGSLADGSVQWRDTQIIFAGALNQANRPTPPAKDEYGTPYFDSNGNPLEYNDSTANHVYIPSSCPGFGRLFPLAATLYDGLMGSISHNTLEFASSVERTVDQAATSARGFQDANNWYDMGNSFKTVSDGAKLVINWTFHGEFDQSSLNSYYFNNQENVRWLHWANDTGPHSTAGMMTRNVRVLLSSCFVSLLFVFFVI